MDTAHAPAPTIESLLERIAALESRVDALEASRASAPRRSRGEAGGSSAASIDASSWTRPYEVAELEVSETWIELHEPSARPQLQRLLREVVTVEGPITERLALDRIRRAWGLRRAGGRVQEAFDQSVRQLVARALIERDGDALRVPDTALDHVRTPSEDEQTRRGAEDVPLVELELALVTAAAGLGGPIAQDELTMLVAKLFGWTRRGGAIQERLDAALARAEAAGRLTRTGDRLTAAAAT